MMLYFAAAGLASGAIATDARLQLQIDPVLALDDETALAACLETDPAPFDRGILVEAWVEQVTFDERGLVPTVVQDATTRDVLARLMLSTTAWNSSIRSEFSNATA